jgi:molybdopterin-guanine dinucleotide biosynthesis protein A
MCRRIGKGLTGLVLAGGQSERMGRDKALMELDGQALISRVLDKLARLSDELIISANDVEPYAHLTARVVADVIPGRGALGGIHAGLAAMRNERALVLACDMPFVSLPLLRYMTVLAADYDVVVPRLGAFYEPLHAVYSAGCVAQIERLVVDKPKRVTELYRHVRVRELSKAEVLLFNAVHSFFNVNTPEDWAEARRLSALGF